MRADSIFREAVVKDITYKIRFNLPREELAVEQQAAGEEYILGAETPLQADPDAVEARFIEPITLIASITLSALALRIFNLISNQRRGVLVDARQNPAVVSRLEDVPAGFVVIIKSDGSTETVAAQKTDESILSGILSKILPGAA
jgi:hypothetical protein